MVVRPEPFQVGDGPSRVVLADRVAQYPSVLSRDLDPLAQLGVEERTEHARSGVSVDHRPPPLPRPWHTRVVSGLLERCVVAVPLHHRQIDLEVGDLDPQSLVAHPARPGARRTEGRSEGRPTQGADDRLGFPHPCRGVAARPVREAPCDEGQGDDGEERERQGRKESAPHHETTISSSRSPAA